jgi:hypothetical protein
MIRKESSMTWVEQTLLTKMNRRETQVIRDFLVELKEDFLAKDMAV